MSASSAVWYLTLYQDCLHKYGRTDKAHCRTILTHRTDSPFRGSTFAAALPVIRDLFAAYPHRAWPNCGH